MAFTEREEPTILQVCEADNLQPEDTYELVKEIGRTVLPPRVFEDGNMNRDFKYFVPRVNTFMGLEPNALKKFLASKGQIKKSPSVKGYENPDAISFSFFGPEGFDDELNEEMVPFSIPLDTHVKIKDLNSEHEDLNQSTLEGIGLGKS